MFTDPGPRVFGLPPGADFPAALMRGVFERLADAPPEEIARAEIIVNTRRMSRRLRTILDAGPARLLPRIRLLTDLSSPGAVPPPVSKIRRRLELVQLISALLDAEPDLAPRAHQYDLADSLAALLDEMQGEGVSPEEIAALKVEDMSGHWERAQRFLNIVTALPRSDDAPDPEARQRRIVLDLLARWEVDPPRHPVILAGSTGSRGTTHMLMQAVARLPQGAVVLPGYDFDMPAALWSELDDSLTAEDHPQFRFRRLMRELDLSPAEIPLWAACPECPTARNRLISLALRPAPVTDQWLEDGPALRPELGEATRRMTLVEAQSARAEATAIALRLRKAAETGETAALITPDRMLTRQVTAALDRWGILPDDSAGTPLRLTPSGRLLRQVAELFTGPLTADGLLALLKHPLVHSGENRREHLYLARALELRLRNQGPPFPGPADIANFAAGKDAFSQSWADWLCSCILDAAAPEAMPLADRVERHLLTANHIAQGSVGEGAGRLWLGDDGEEAARLMENLAEDAPVGGDMNARDYADLFEAVLADGEVRNPEEPHPRILIWGTLEARVQGADLVILGGLNEGSWPEVPAPDPWLNRQMRKQAGLLLPERRIGLSAHDFQQAIGAGEVWLTRSIRSQDAETVASRWVNRLVNLLNGLQPEGPQVLADMRERGEHWLALARLAEAPIKSPPAPRPSPAPPAEARPRKLPVTDIQKLIRDPYAIYARRVLRLSRLNPLMKAPDALMRGIIMHDVFETFLRDVTGGAPLTAERLIATARDRLAEHVPWGETRALWLARFHRIADWFIAGEAERQLIAGQWLFEKQGKADIPAHGFTLTATADRIDVDLSGDVHLFDYKTGTPPSKAQQKSFDKQLLLEAAIAEQAGFGDLGPRPVARAVYLGLGSKPGEVPAPLDEEPVEKVWAEFCELIGAYMAPAKGFTARRAMFDRKAASDYDLLSRHGEWDVTMPPDVREVR